MKPSDHELERRLRRGAPRQDAPDGFAEDVVRRLKHAPGADPERMPRPISTLHWLRPLVAAVAVLLLVVLNWEPADPLPEPPAPAVANNTLAPGPSLDFALPEVRVEAFGEFPETLDEPLEKELESILADARNAVNYLAFNFLPENSSPR